MLVAYALGNKNIGEAKRLFTRAFMLSIGLGVLLAVFGGIIFPDETAQLLCSNKQILPLANEYMRILLLGNPAFILMWGLSTMVGVDGSPKLVSVAVIIDNAVNLFLDIVFIQWFGWGIAGSSAATIVGHLVGIAILLSHWVNPEHRRLTLDFSFDNLPSSWRRIVSQGAPLAIASISLTLLLLSANTIVLNTLGRTGIFAFAVCMNLLQVYNLFLSGTCQTLQSLGAIQVGKGDNEGLHLILRKAFRFITVAMAITCLFVWISPTTIVRLFGTNEPAFVYEGNYALRIFALMLEPLIPSERTIRSSILP
jgi:Na+-driven multidrug efflux pump